MSEIESGLRKQVSALHEIIDDLRHDNELLLERAENASRVRRFRVWLADVLWPPKVKR